MSWSVPGYVEIKDLGRGASGRVVLAEHEASGTKVAIKYLADHLTHDPEFAEAFRAEARILSEVEDPQIARLYEYVEAPEGAAIVMELVDGVALRAILREHGPTEPQSALVVLKGSLLGLAAAHGHGIVHRDYKPENVLVSHEGQSKLADFGIAARTGLKGAHAGTPSYMAPEQWAGAPATPSTDIYAATATFFECLTGHPPYRSPGDVIGLRYKHENEPIPADEVPEAIRGLVRRGLAKRSDQRPRDAATFLIELEAVAGAGYGPEWEEEGRGALARRAALLLLLFPLAGAAAGGTGVAQTVLGWSKKSTNMALAGGLALVLAVAGFFYYQNASSAEPRTTAEVSSETTASPTPGILPSPTPEPSLMPSELPSPSASASPTRTPTRTPTTRPPTTTPPPPPPPRVVSWVAPKGADDYCWLYKNMCYPQPDQPNRAKVHIVANTATGAPFTVTLRFVQVYLNDAGAEQEDLGVPARVVTLQAVMSGNTGTVDHIEDLGRLYQNSPCRWNSERPRIKLTISASIQAPSAGTFYINDCYQTIPQ